MRVARRLALLLVSAALSLAALDVALRLARPALPVRLANYLFSRYRSDLGGIYFREPTTGMNFMWPGQEAENVFNGLRWRHRTDDRGFRDPPGISTEVLLLGDSMIYGHGVEEEETVAARLRREHRIPAYDMARQGGCLYDYYVLLRLWLPRLQPRVVVLFVFLNDFRDLEIYRTPRQLDSAPELEIYDYAQLQAATQRRQRQAPPHWLAELASLPSLRAVRAAGLSLARLGAGARAPEEGGAADLLGPIEDPVRLRPLASYSLRLLTDLAARARGQGTELRLVALASGSAEPRFVVARRRVAALVADWGRDLGLATLDTEAGLAGCGECFLPVDGHLSPAGHRRLAELMAAWLQGAEPSTTEPPTRP